MVLHLASLASNMPSHTNPKSELEASTFISSTIEALLEKNTVFGLFEALPLIDFHIAPSAVTVRVHLQDALSSLSWHW